MTLQAPETLGQKRYESENVTVRNADRRGVTAVTHANKRNGARNTPWLAEKVAISRRQAKKTTCPRCGANILEGDDHDKVAATARVDPNPVTQLDEVVGILNHLHSYNLVRGALHHRDWQVGRTSTHPIHLEHRCADR